MTNDQAAAQPFNFNNVEAAKGYNNTEPGTIGNFIISETEFVKSRDKGTPGLKCTFTHKTDGSTFPHTFWLTAGALPRIQAMAEVALGQKLSGDITGPNLCAMFKGKELPLKVTAQIDEKKGRVYADLPFGGFTDKDISELKFSANEKAEIEKSKTVTVKSDPVNADTEDDGIDTSSNVGNEADAGEF